MRLVIKNPLVTELFIRGRKLIISLFLLDNLISQFQKSVRLNSTHCFVMNIPNKTGLQQIALIIHQILTSKTL